MGTERLIAEMIAAGLLAIVSLAALGWSRKARRPAWTALGLGVLGALVLTVLFVIEGLPHPAHAIVWFLIFAFPATAASSLLVLIAMANRQYSLAPRSKHVA